MRLLYLDQLIHERELVLLMRNIHLILYVFVLIEIIRKLQPAAYNLLTQIVVESADLEE
jgi:hypothetical protein